MKCEVASPAATAEWCEGTCTPDRCPEALCKCEVDHEVELKIRLAEAEARTAAAEKRTRAAQQQTEEPEASAQQQSAAGQQGSAGKR